MAGLLFESQAWQSCGMLSKHQNEKTTTCRSCVSVVNHGVLSLSSVSYGFSARKKKNIQLPNLMHVFKWFLCESVFVRHHEGSIKQHTLSSNCWSRRKTKTLSEKTNPFSAFSGRTRVKIKTTVSICVSVQECTPFAVIGSNTVVEARGQRVRGRLYPWGIVEGELTFNTLLQTLRLNLTTGLTHYVCTVQWKTSHTVILWNWGTCWFVHTCTTWRTWPVTSTMKTTEHSAYRRWPGTSLWQTRLLHVLVKGLSGIQFCLFFLSFFLSSTPQ